MKVLFFSTDIALIGEWEKRETLYDFLSCHDTKSLENAQNKEALTLIIADYDSVAHEINKMISSNTLPKNVIVLEKAPEIATGKKLVMHGVKNGPNRF